MKKYGTCLLLASSLLLSGAALAQEYKLSVAFTPGYQDTPVSVIPNSTHCARAMSGIVHFSDGAARMVLDTNKSDIASCRLQQSDVTYNVVDSKHQTILSFKFYTQAGQKQARLIPISTARGLSCQYYQKSLEVGCRRRGSYPPASA